MPDLSPAQQSAVDLAAKWYENFDPDQQPIFVISGYAGTGKTTTLKALTAAIGADALYAAYTGKAALVISKYNDVSASTIHSLIYRPKDPDKKLCEELFEKIKTTTNDSERKELRQELRQAQQVTFELNDDSDLTNADLLNLDEVSMVDDEMKTDLLRFKRPIIALGDPGQLPPVKGTGSIFNGEPDVLLTEIHRQAADNPIIDLTVRARKGIPFAHQEHGRARVMPKGSLSWEEIAQADQVICGKNATRRDLNEKLRMVAGRREVYPEPGDKLICLRNHAQLGLFNGLMAQVVETGDLTDNAIKLKIATELSPDEPIWVDALRAHFDVYTDGDALENVKWWQRRDTEEFDFGYAITGHKSQGSQYENLVVMDDRFGVWNRDLRKQWMYTVASRAVETITWLR